MSYQHAMHTLQWSTHLVDYQPSQALADRIKKDWDSFIDQALEMGFDPHNDILNYGDYYENDVWELVAHDFILTRNGNEAGFWDGDWHEPIATKLTELCKKFGEIDIYVSDKNLLEAY